MTDILAGSAFVCPSCCQGPRSLRLSTEDIPSPRHRENLASGAASWNLGGPRTQGREKACDADWLRMSQGYVLI